MSRSWKQIAEVIGLIGGATNSEVLLRAFFQLNDDLAVFPDLASLSASDVEFPNDSSRAALVAGALAFWLQEQGKAVPSWLRDARLVAADPVFLITGLRDVVREQTPSVLAEYNVFIDRDSLVST